MADEPLTPDARTRAADLFEDHAESLARNLAAHFSGVDPQLISDAVTRAILRVSAHPDSYDSGRGSLAAFLTGVARRVLSTRLRAERRRRHREQEKAIDPVTAADAVANTILNELIDRELAERVRAALALNPNEDRVLDLWLLGEKDLSSYAVALGLVGRPPQEQEEAIRRVLARLRQRIHRAGVRLRQEGLSE